MRNSEANKNQIEKERRNKQPNSQRTQREGRTFHCSLE